MSDAPIPNFKIYAEGEPIPPVDPEHLKRRWNMKKPCTRKSLEAAWTQEADRSAVSRRGGMIQALTTYKLLTPWQRGEELDEPAKAARG